MIGKAFSTLETDMGSTHIITKMYDVMTSCLTVKQLRDILTEISDAGKGDLGIGYRIGRTDDGKCISFPVSSVSIAGSSDDKVIIFCPIAYDENDEPVIDFDTSIKFNDDSIEVSIIDYSEKGENE